MRKYVIIGVVIFGMGTSVFAQNLMLSASPQLYVIKTDGKTLFTDSNGLSVKEDDANSVLLVYLNPNWIDTIDILKGQDATDKYGERGKNGVVLMTLRKDSFDKLRPSDQEKFRKD